LENYLGDNFMVKIVRQELFLARGQEKMQNKAKEENFSCTNASLLFAG